MHEMRDIGPEGFVAVHKVKGWAQGFRLNAHPQVVDILGGQFSLPSGRVQFAFEIVKCDLAHDRVDHVFDLAGQHHLAFGLVFGTVKHFAEGEHFAKDGGGFCQGERGRGEHFTLTCGQYLMHAVAQFMRQSHDIAGFAQIVQHHIGMCVDNGGMRKSAWCLACFDRCINPAFVKEGLRQISHARIKGTIGIHHHFTCFIPCNNACAFHW